MASAVFITAIQNIMKAYLVDGTADIRCRLCMSNTTCATAALTDSPNIDDITTVDESDATGYADVELTTEIVNLDDANDRAEFDDDGAVAAVFSGLSGDATRDYAGVLLYKYIDGTDANDIPVAWIEFGSPVVKESTSVTVTWNAEGIIQGRNA